MSDLDQILKELAYIKQHMPNGELKRIEQAVNDLKKDMSDMKKTLLDPNDGVIVHTNKNTEWREERQKKIDLYDEKVNELDKLIDWKNGVTKVLWVGFTAMIGIIAKLLADTFK
jgi:superfamily I DNA/RNA helicase